VIQRPDEVTISTESDRKGLDGGRTLICVKSSNLSKVYFNQRRGCRDIVGFNSIAGGDVVEILCSIFLCNTRGGYFVNEHDSAETS